MTENTARHFKQQCAIVVPVYRKPTKTEILSLRCLDRVLSGYPRFLLKPLSLKLDLEGFSDCSMEDAWFSSTKTYGLLMASSMVYEKFLSFEFILIYQLDCLVFKDELSYWCSLGYDLCSSACFKGSFGWQNQDFVSAGGLSLRKVDSCLKILKRIESDRHACEEHSKWILADGAEDVWWGLVAPTLEPAFRIISVEDSLRFSFHSDPTPYILRSAVLPPFACHGWLSLKRLYVYYRFLPFSAWDKLWIASPAAVMLLLRVLAIRLRWFRGTMKVFTR